MAAAADFFSFFFFMLDIDSRLLIDRSMSAGSNACTVSVSLVGAATADFGGAAEEPFGAAVEEEPNELKKPPGFLDACDLSFVVLTGGSLFSVGLLAADEDAQVEADAGGGGGAAAWDRGLSRLGCAVGSSS